jgi:voltage-gated potassium channel
MIMALLFSSSVMYICENKVQPEKFSSIPAAMWWGMATLTTVGYGDVSPITPIGQLFGIITMVIGIGMFALPAGIIATGFSNEMDRMNFTVNWKLVSKVPLFKQLDAPHIADIVSLLTPKIIPANYAILKFGEKAQSMYFIVSGQLEVHLSDGSVILESGDFFGEMAILNDTVRNANVFSKTECKLLELKSEQLKYLMNMHPELNSKIEYIINARHENIK